MLTWPQSGWLLFSCGCLPSVNLIACNHAMPGKVTSLMHRPQGRELQQQQTRLRLCQQVLGLLASALDGLLCAVHFDIQTVKNIKI